MTRIAYLLLGHNEPERLARLAGGLVAGGDRAAIHYDARAAGFEDLARSVASRPGIALAPRIACGWGEWSLVEATLSALRTALAAFPDATHLYLVSGDCAPVKPADWIRARLAADPVDHIETHDFWTSGWIRTGLTEERVRYRHIFNERTQKRRFYAALALQKALRLERRPPKGLPLRIGSQWWCLRRATAEAVLDLVERRPDIVRFFRRTWIPDETFFQSLVAHLVPSGEIRSAAPTFHMFSDYGLPVLFYADHSGLLEGQDAFFCRKIAPDAQDLRERLLALYAERGHKVRVTGEGRAAYAYLARQGREGLRGAPRAWETGATVGAGREILVLVCKKWHVAKRLAERLSQVTNLPALGYVFDDTGAELPDLGGLETSLDKRRRHRRSFLRLLFDHFGADKLLVCLDPGNLEALRDLAGDRARMRVLEIDCLTPDEWLRGHAVRIGVLHDASPADLSSRVLAALRQDLARETARLRDAGLPGHVRFGEDADPAVNAAALASFLAIPEDKARPVADTEHLFAD